MLNTINGRNKLAVEVCGKSGKRRIEARMFVDASGDCDIAFLAGLEPNKGREGRRQMPAYDDEF